MSSSRLPGVAAAANAIMPADLTDFVRAAGIEAGLSVGAAAMLAEPLVLADMMGVHTHGTKLLPGYIRKLLAGGYRPQAAPRGVREGPAWAVVDGEAALGQVGCTTAVRLAIKKAKQMGVATVAIRNTGHIGAAGFYALLAARQGCPGIVTGNDIPSVAAPGSRGPVFGSNPLAWSVARPYGRPQGLRLRNPGRIALRRRERRQHRVADRRLDERSARGTFAPRRRPPMSITCSFPAGANGLATMPPKPGESSRPAMCEKKWLPLPRSSGCRRRSEQARSDDPGARVRTLGHPASPLASGSR